MFHFPLSSLGHLVILLNPVLFATLKITTGWSYNSIAAYVVRCIR